MTESDDGMIYIEILHGSCNREHVSKTTSRRHTELVDANYTSICVRTVGKVL